MGPGHGQGQEGGGAGMVKETRIEWQEGIGLVGGSCVFPFLFFVVIHPKFLFANWSWILLG